MGNGYGGLLFIGEKGKIMWRACAPTACASSPRLRWRPTSVPENGRRARSDITRNGSRRARAVRRADRIDYAGPLTETVLLGNIAHRYPQRLEWDAEAMKIKNVPEANEWLMRKYRDGWKLE